MWHYIDDTRLETHPYRLVLHLSEFLSNKSRTTLYAREFIEMTDVSIKNVRNKDRYVDNYTIII